MYFDPLYFVLLGPAVLLAVCAHFTVKWTYKRYSRVGTVRGVDGARTVDVLMRTYSGRAAIARGFEGAIPAGVMHIGGNLTDYYDPSTKRIALSDTAHTASVAAVAVAAHEFGHAMQDAEHDPGLKLRGAVVPVVNIGSQLAPYAFMAGMWFHSPALAWVGVLGYSLAAFFSLITLPVEFDASRRALRYLTETGLLTRE
ncbi:MAG: zinc metallopeptidase, partial [Armatimonadota bacterium]